MTLLDHDAYCAHLTEQTALLRDALRTADLGTPVPTCPDCTLRDLAPHVGGAHRWAETIVRTRTTEYRPGAEVPGGPPPEDADGLDRWLADGAGQLAGVLRETGPDVEVWAWGRNHTAGFWARRMALEPLVHRADAAFAVGAEYRVAPELAADVLDEWLELISWPPVAEFRTELKELRGAGETLHLHATDTDPALGAEWLITRGPDGPDWAREHGKADVALRGPLTAVMLAFLRRLPLDAEGLEVLGDRALLDHWLAHTAF